MESVFFVLLLKLWAGRVFWAPVDFVESVCFVLMLKLWSRSLLCFC